MKIKNFTGKIISIIDLSKTAKEIEIQLSEQIDFIPGSFVNVFMDIDGVRVRRAYSVASSNIDHTIITLAVRLSREGTMSKLFWGKDMNGEVLDLMGPLGLNTVDKMNHRKVYLFAFGIGAGVVKYMAHYFSHIKRAGELVIMTGSRTPDEIIYKDYFNGLARDFENVKAVHVVSGLNDDLNIPKGYIQDHISDYDFKNSDVYVCGQEKACEDLVNKVKSMNPSDCNYYIEAFH